MTKHSASLAALVRADGTTAIGFCFHPKGNPPNPRAVDEHAIAIPLGEIEKKK